MGFRIELTESIAALAADAAEESPRALITAAPRCWTVFTNSPVSQSWSPMTSGTGLPPISALRASGNWVAEWLPQTARLVTSSGPTPAFAASSPLPRFWSRRIIANQRSAGTSGALLRAMRQLVLHGLPTTSTWTPAAATSPMTRPCSEKIFAFTPSRSLRSIPSLRGIAPTSSAHSTPSKARRGSLVATTSLRSGKAQSSSSMTTPSSAFMAGSTSSNRRTRGWSGPSRWPEPIRKTRA